MKFVDRYKERTNLSLAAVPRTRTRLRQLDLCFLQESSELCVTNASYEEPKSLEPPWSDGQMTAENDQLRPKSIGLGNNIQDCSTNTAYCILTTVLTPCNIQILCIVVVF